MIEIQSMKQLAEILLVYMIQVLIKLAIRLTAGKDIFQFEKLPQFTPELFVRVTAKNVMKQKHFHKGIQQLVQEGAIQLFKTVKYGRIFTWSSWSTSI